MGSPMKLIDECQELLEGGHGDGAPHASFLLGTGEQVNGTPCPSRLEMSYCQSELSGWDSGFNLQEETQWLFH